MAGSRKLRHGADGRFVGRPLLDYVEIKGPDECWPWRGGAHGKGYGDYQGHLAHRVVYEALVGPIPSGLTLDHVCHNAADWCEGGSTCPHRRCCNPKHLEAVPGTTNHKRGKAGQLTGRKQRAKTRCPAGHRYDDENTYWDRKGHRRCRACHRERMR